jgi:HK97 family phage major capsid protein
VTFTSSSEKVRLIACTIPATRQVLDDFQALNDFLSSTLGYYTNLATEIQILSGDGTGENLSGLIPAASSFNTGLLTASAGWQRIDVLAHAAQRSSPALRS